MTSKNSFFKLLKEDLLQRLWSIILAMVVIILPITVAVALEISNIRADRYSYRENAIASLWRVFEYDNFWFYLVAIVGAIICAGCSFCYLFSKRKVDFFHSLPVTRGKLFAVRYVSGVLVYLVPNILMLLLNFIIISAFFGASSTPALYMLGGFLFHFAGFLIIYSAAAVCIFLVGNMAVFFVIATWFFFFLPFVVVLITGMQESFFDTFYRGSESFTTMMNQLRFVSPGYFYVGWMTNTLGETEVNLFAFALQLILNVVLLTAVAILLYRKRPSEGAGKAIVFEWAKPLVRISLEIFAGASLAYLFYNMVWDRNSDCGWIFFGALIGVALCHMFVESVFHYDVKKCFAHKGSLLVSILAAAAVVLVMRYDLIGYDDYLPKKKSIESVELISMEGLEQVSRNFSGAVIEDIDAIYPFLTACRDFKFDGGENIVYSAGQQMSTRVIRVGIKKKSGIVVYRKYRISNKMMADYFGSVFDSADYKENTLQGLRELKPEWIESIRFTLEEREVTLANAVTEKEKQEFIQTLISGYERETWKTRCDEAPLFLVYLEVEYPNEGKGKHFVSYAIPVYASYTEAIRFAEQKGFSVKEERDWSKVDYMLIMTVDGSELAILPKTVTEASDTYVDYELLAKETGEYYGEYYGDYYGDYYDNNSRKIEREDWEQLYQYCIWNRLAEFGIPELYTASNYRVVIRVRLDDFGNYDILTYNLRKGANLSFLGE